MGAKTFEVTSDNFKHDVLEAAQPVLVDFWAEWCGPCRMVAPIVDQIADENTARLRVGKLDTDAYPDVPMAYDIMSIPTLILFKGGEAVVRITGFQPKDRILSQIAPHLG